jgi:DNA processing protein
LPNDNYPSRLRECPDAPLLFYYKGNADLKARHILGIVGTRKASAYGRALTERLVHDLAGSFPDTVILSGLAYGIDVQAHRSALKEQLPTVAVLAHGLDRIYPQAHRSIAAEMIERGGLLTDFPSGTEPDKPNFLKRNRIVAGLSEATVVVESGEWGGSLVTADIAFSYSRDVFTFPGRVDDASSIGCNQLIRKNKAGLITSAADLIEALGWGDKVRHNSKAIQTRILFPENSMHKRIVDILHEYGEIHINQLAVELGSPVHQLSALLFEMEMDQAVTSAPGNIYKLA